MPPYRANCFQVARTHKRWPWHPRTCPSWPICSQITVKLEQKRLLTIGLFDGGLFQLQKYIVWDPGQKLLQKKRCKYLLLIAHCPKSWPAGPTDCPRGPKFDIQKSKFSAFWPKNDNVSLHRPHLWLRKGVVMNFFDPIGPSGSSDSWPELPKLANLA